MDLRLGEVPGQKVDLTEPYLVAGEGSPDEELVRQLCILNNIVGYQYENFEGITKLRTWLSGVKARRGYQNLSLILIVADSDDSPDDAFDQIRRDLRAVGLPQPNNAFELARRDNCPAIKVVLLPFRAPNVPQRGCIESLLLRSALPHLRRFEPCVDQFCECVEAHRWAARSHIDKLRMRALLSGANQADPYLGVQYALKPAANLIPLDHECFHPLIEILRETPNEVLRLQARE